MTDTNVSKLYQPGTFADPLTEILRNGARALLAEAVEAEVAALLSCHADKLTDDGRQRLVRHGHLPEREIMTGIGPVAVTTEPVIAKFGTMSVMLPLQEASVATFANPRNTLPSPLPLGSQELLAKTSTR